MLLAGGLPASSRRASCGCVLRGESTEWEAPCQGRCHRVRPLLDAGHGSRVVEDELDEIDVAIRPTVECQEVTPSLDEDHPTVAGWGNNTVDEGNAAVGEEGAPQEIAHGLTPRKAVNVGGLV